MSAPERPQGAERVVDGRGVDAPASDAPSAPAAACSAPRWGDLQRVVDGALDRPTEARTAYLDAACGADTALRAHAARLLDACARVEQGDGFLAAPAAAFAGTLLTDGAPLDLVADALRAAVAGRYTVERELGRGGMATVYLARDLRHERPVAVKVLAQHVVGSAGAARFLHEIRTVARLTHPHILGVHDSGAGEGLLYFVMPYVPGETLRARLTREGALPIPVAVGLLRDVARALAYAHRQGVVHRDIKPENILLGEDGDALVADFGVAKALAAGGTDGPPARPGALTGAGVLLGTPAYMAPEQAAADPATDHRADLYALGVVAYELLAGRPPFVERTAQALVAAHATAAPEAITARRPDVPPALAALVLHCLAKRPDDRPQHATEFLRSLESGAMDGPPGADCPAVGAHTPAGAGPAAGPVTAVPATRRPRRGVALMRRPAALFVALPLTIAVAVGGGWAMHARARDATPATRDTARSAGTGAAAPAGARVLVDLFENRTGDATLDPVGQMAADWVVRGLAETNLVDVVDASTATALARGDAPAARGAESALGGMDRMLRVAGAMGAGTLVVGRYYRRGDSLEFQAQVVDARDGRLLRSIEPTAGLVTAPGAVVGVLRSRVMMNLARLFDPELTAWPTTGEFRTSPSYEVYREAQAGQALFTRGEFRAALAQLERVERLDSTVIAPRFTRVLCYTNLGEPARADSLLRTINRTSGRLTSLEGTSLDWLAASLRGDLPAAYELIKTAAALAPNTPPHVQLGSEAMRVGRVREAVAVYRAIDPEAPAIRGWPSYWGNRVWAHHLAGELDEALAVARRARVRLPTQSTVVRSEATALAALGRAAELDALLDERAARATDDPAAHGRLLVDAAAELRAHGHAAAGRALAERAVAWLQSQRGDEAARPVRDRGADPVRAALITALYAANQWREARALVEPLARADSADVAMLAYAGLTAARLGDTLAARRVDARLAAGRTPYRYGEPTYQRARLAAVLGEPARAVALLREAFAQGRPYYRSHAEGDFEGLRGYAPFEDWVRPKE